MALSLTAPAHKAAQPISVLAQPEKDSFDLGSEVIIKIAITNNSGHRLWFESCPDPYTIQLTDSSGRVVPYKLLPKGTVEMPICFRNIGYTILPGKTWATDVAINGNFDLKEGAYWTRFLWHFPWNSRKTQPGSDWDTLTVSSNTTRLTIGQQQR